MRLVLDTNVLLAAVLADGLCRDLVRKRVQGHTLVTSQVLLDELADKLQVKFGLTPKEVPLFNAYVERAVLIECDRLPRPVCRDPDDDFVLATAHAGGANVIVTGDKDLLVLVEHDGVPILSPRQFLEALDRHWPG